MTDKKEGTKSKEGSRASSPTKQRAGAESKQSNHSTQQKDKNYFQCQLQRLQQGLEKEKTQIKKPKKKEFTPSTFNSLSAYFNTNVASQVVYKAPQQPNGYQNRETAIGLCDPWTDHTMDQGTQKVPTSKTPVHDNNDTGSNKKTDKKKTGSKKTKEGSTRLPKFPAVSVPAGDLTTKPLYYSDVPMLRKQLREKYGANADAKIEGEYTRTKQDYYRMDLDRIEEYHPVNRDHMRKTYFAYLQNNPGSKKAIYECVRESQKDLDEAENDSHSQTGSRPASSRSYHSRPQSSRSRQSVKAS